MMTENFPTWDDILDDVYDVKGNSDKSDLLSQYRVNIEQLLIKHPEHSENMQPILKMVNQKIKHYDKLVMQEVKSKHGRIIVPDVSTALDESVEVVYANSDSQDVATITKKQSKSRSGDVIDLDRNYSIEDAASILGRAKNTMYDYNNRKRPDGSSNPKIPYHKDESGKVWYLGSDLLEFRDLARQSDIQSSSDISAPERRKHEGKGKRVYDPQRDHSKMSLPELKKLKMELIKSGKMK